MRGSPWLLLALVGCADGGGFDPHALACEGTGGIDAGLSFHEQDMPCVQLTMHPDDFDAMAAEQRWGEDEEDLWAGTMAFLLEGCTAPFPESYTWFEADLVADGELLESVGVRKKGFVGSALEGARWRPSLKIKTDKWVEDQTLDETERVTLNNNLTDATRMHTCLSYSVFDDAGYPAPRCNLANVMVNGQPLGAYSHVEALKRRFLERAFGDDSGHLYEGIIADFTPDHLAGTPESLGHWEAKTDDTDPGGEPLWAVTEALQAPDDELEAALGAVVNLDRFFTFWALETLLAHTDGYTAGTNNFYVYFDPSDGGRATLIPWGTDDTMSTGGAFDDPAWLHRLFLLSELSRRLSRHPVLAPRYTAELERILDEVWDEDTLHRRIERMAAQVTTAEDHDRHADRVAELKDWIAGRRAQLEQRIAEGTPEGSETPGNCYSRLHPQESVDNTAEIATLAHACASTGRRRGLWWLLAVGLVVSRFRGRRA
jgi:spore coat protein H